LHAQLFVLGPVLVQVACGSQPPFCVRQELMGTQTVPVPEYPVVHAQEFVPGPVGVHVA